MPGDNVLLDFEMTSAVPVEPGLRFTVREGGKTIGTGVIVKVAD